MVYVLLAEGFEEIEAIEPVDIIRRAGVAVQTVGVSGKMVTGSHEITVKADISIDEVVAGAMNMLILPGGPGHANLDNDKKVHALIDFANEQEIYIASICAAPSILGKKGLLNGKKATCFPGYEKYLEGAMVVNQKVVTDGKYITACGAGAASEFGFKIVEVLKGRTVAENLKESMLY